MFHNRQRAYFCVLLSSSILGINNSYKHKLKAGSDSTMWTKGCQVKRILHTARFKINLEHKNYFHVWHTSFFKNQWKQSEGEIRRKQGYSPWSSNCFLFCVQLPQQSWVVSWRCQERLASPAPHRITTHPFTYSWNGLNS